MPTNMKQSTMQSNPYDGYNNAPIILNQSITYTTTTTTSSDDKTSSSKSTSDKSTNKRLDDDIYRKYSPNSVNNDYNRRNNPNNNQFSYRNDNSPTSNNGFSSNNASSKNTYCSCCDDPVIILNRPQFCKCNSPFYSGSKNVAYFNSDNNNGGFPNQNNDSANTNDNLDFGQVEHDNFSPPLIVDPNRGNVVNTGTTANNNVEKDNIPLNSGKSQRTVNYNEDEAGPSNQGKNAELCKKCCFSDQKDSEEKKTKIISQPSISKLPTKSTGTSVEQDDPFALMPINEDVFEDIDTKDYEDAISNSDKSRLDKIKSMHSYVEENPDNSLQEFMKGVLHNRARIEVLESSLRDIKTCDCSPSSEDLNKKKVAPVISVVEPKKNVVEPKKNVEVKRPSSEDTISPEESFDDKLKKTDFGWVAPILKTTPNVSDTRVMPRISQSSDGIDSLNLSSDYSSLDDIPANSTILSHSISHPGHKPRDNTTENLLYEGSNDSYQSYNPEEKDSSKGIPKNISYPRVKYYIESDNSITTENDENSRFADSKESEERDSSKESNDKIAQYDPQSAKDSIDRDPTKESNYGKSPHKPFYATIDEDPERELEDLDPSKESNHKKLSSKSPYTPFHAYAPHSPKDSIDHDPEKELEDRDPSKESNHKKLLSKSPYTPFHAYAPHSPKDLIDDDTEKELEDRDPSKESNHEKSSSKSPHPPFYSYAPHSPKDSIDHDPEKELEYRDPSKESNHEKSSSKSPHPPFYSSSPHSPKDSIDVNPKKELEDRDLSKESNHEKLSSKSPHPPFYSNTHSPKDSIDHDTEKELKDRDPSKESNHEKISSKSPHTPFHAYAPHSPKESTDHDPENKSDQSQSTFKNPSSSHFDPNSESDNPLKESDHQDPTARDSFEDHDFDLSSDNDSLADANVTYRNKEDQTVSEKTLINIDDLNDDNSFGTEFRKSIDTSIDCLYKGTEQCKKTRLELLTFMDEGCNCQNSILDKHCHCSSQNNGLELDENQRKQKDKDVPSTSKQKPNNEKDQDSPMYPSNYSVQQAFCKISEFPMCTVYEVMNVDNLNEIFKKKFSPNGVFVLKKP